MTDVALVLTTVSNIQKLVGTSIEWELVEANTTGSTVYMVITGTASMRLSNSDHDELQNSARFVSITARDGAFHVCMWRPSWLLHNTLPPVAQFAFGNWRKIDFTLPPTLSKSEAAVAKRCVHLLCNCSRVQAIPDMHIDDSHATPVLIFSNFTSFDMDMAAHLLKNVKLGIAFVSVHVASAPAALTVHVHMVQRDDVVPPAAALSGTKRVLDDVCPSSDAKHAKRE